MKLSKFKMSKSRILRVLFGWSLCLPSKVEPATPFDGKITKESEEESWADQLEVADDSVLRQTDPLLMTRKERHESTVRYWMERKGFERREIEKPLTEERMNEIGRKSFGNYKESKDAGRKKYVESFGRAFLLDQPSDLDLDSEKSI